MGAIFSTRQSGLCDVEVKQSTEVADSGQTGSPSLPPQAPPPRPPAALPLETSLRLERDGPEIEIHDVRLSKYLTKLLRHKALEAGVQIDPEGWADVADAVRWANGMEVNAVIHRMEDAENAVSWTEVS